MKNKTYTEIPLYVDLDQTLIKTDLLYETFIEFIKQHPLNILLSIKWLLKGKAFLKYKLAQKTFIDVENLPYNEPFLSYLKSEQNNGRKIILATASNIKLAKRISNHLNLFSEIIASDEKNNIKGKTKLNHIKENSANGLFAYAGNSKNDLIIFQHAKSSILVNFREKLVSRSPSINVAKSFPPTKSIFPALIRAIRPHQWVKNFLIFVPLLLSNQWYISNLIIRACIGFISFSLIASSVYLINDIFDIQNDRAHPTKQHRPLAAGDITIGHAIILSIVFTLAALFVGYLLNIVYFFLLVTYLLLTFFYSMYLKKLTLIDVFILSQFYTIRVASGGIITNIKLSFWLLAFSVFLFFSLAIAKRYAELISSYTSSQNNIKGRGYNINDSTILNIMGLTSAYIAVLVLALYINSPEVLLIYSSPKILWGVCLIMFFWTSHVWIKTTRGEMEQDPITFAIYDSTSIVLFLLLLTNIILAIII